MCVVDVCFVVCGLLCVCCWLLVVRCLFSVVVRCLLMVDCC